LQAALSWLEPRSCGRPPRSTSERTDKDARVVELETALRDLRVDLRAARIREEIALVLPHLVERRGRVKKAVRSKRRLASAGEDTGVNGQRESATATCVLRR